MKTNFILNTDSYKTSQWVQYPKHTEIVFSYIESRGGVYDKTLFFGLQKFLIDINNNFPTLEDIEEAKIFTAAHGVPFFEEGWRALVELGYFPIEIKAVPEGTLVPVKNIMLSIQNTIPEFYWLTSYMETALLRAIWYPTTVATQSYNIKKVIEHYALLTSEIEDISFKLHDFGARGVSSEESAGIGAMAHLVNFMGTDTMTGILYANRYYDSGVCGYSIPATEHSTITSWEQDNEQEAYENMIKKYPTGIIAIVSDSYNIFNAVNNIMGDKLRMKILGRDGTLVVRPDSGDPKVIVPILLESIGKRFSYQINAKGFKVLNSKIRIIWGDGINQKSIEEILYTMIISGWAIDNITFGMGGALLQQIDRDTQQFAMKCSAVKVDGKWIDVYKDPITDKGKTSKKGVITLTDNMVTKRVSELKESETEIIRTVYKDGIIVKKQTFNEIREISNSF